MQKGLPLDLVQRDSFAQKVTKSFSPNSKLPSKSCNGINPPSKFELLPQTGPGVKHVIKWHAVRNAPDYSVRAKSIPLSPVFERFGLTIKRDQYCIFSGALVLRLLPSSGPPAVFLGISKIVINPVDTMFSGRAWAHVFVEAGERLLPAITDRDTSATPVLKSCRVRIGAAVDNPTPDMVLRGVALPVISLPQMIKTPARLSRRPAKVAYGSHKQGATMAGTQPLKLSITAPVNRANNYSFSKDLPRKVSSLRREWYTAVRHDDTSNIGAVRGAEAANFRPSTLSQAPYRRQLSQRILDRF